MTLDTKKSIGLGISIAAGIVLVAGLVLTALQIPKSGAGHFVTYLFYSVPFCGLGLFVAWWPAMHNYGWSLRFTGRRLRFVRRNRVIDSSRKRLVYWSAVTFFVELHALVVFNANLFGSAADLLSVVCLVCWMGLMLAWIIAVAREDRSDGRDNA